MSYTASFWSFDKRDNSTKLPNTPAKIYQCDLMDGSGMLSPTLIINDDDPIFYNYCYIDAFMRYYFVNNWRYSLGFWTCELQVDVLASWKSNILAQQLYILRSYNNPNLSITDTLYPMIAGEQLHNYEYITNLFNTNYGDGTFITGIVNTDPNTIGAISYYAFTSAQMRDLLTKLMGDVNFYGVQDISQELTKILANPFQYIVSCRWLPISISDIPVQTMQSTIKIGWWTYTVDGYALGSSTIYETTYQITIPKHPQQTSRGDYLARSPYSEYYLVFAPFGSFSLPPEKMVSSTKLHFKVSVDILTGAGVLIVSSDYGFVTRVEGIIGADIALAQLAPTTESILNSPVFSTSKASLQQAGASAASAFSIAVQESGITSVINSAMDVVSGIANAYLTSICPAQISGNNGGINGGRFDIELHGWFETVADSDPVEKGYPCCERLYLAWCSGYTQCGEADIEIPCTKPENQMIKSYLVSGFFIE